MARDRLQLGLLVKNAPANIGEQVHINHEGCPMGEDTKRRLYVKRVSGGILGYCHHCGLPGFVKSSSPDGESLSKWLQGKSKVDLPEEISDTGFTFDNIVYGTEAAKLPLVGGMEWLLKYNLGTNSPYIGINKDDPNQVIMYLYGPDNRLIGKQIRNTIKSPKYITTYFSEDRGDAAWFFKPNQPLVITEDYLSAYKIHLLRGSSVALLRTSLTTREQHLFNIFVPKSTPIHLWLDADAAGKKATKQISERLSYLGWPVTKIDSKLEAKETLIFELQAGLQRLGVI